MASDVLIRQKPSLKLGAMIKRVQENLSLREGLKGQGPWQLQETQQVFGPFFSRAPPSV